MKMVFELGLNVGQIQKKYMGRECICVLVSDAHAGEEG